MVLLFTHKKKPSSKRGLREPPTSAIKLISAAIIRVAGVKVFVKTLVNNFRNSLTLYLDKLGVCRV